VAAVGRRVLEGRATAAGTARFATRFSESVDTAHFRAFGDLAVSSIGLGTYLGDETDEDDASYEDAIEAALQAGCNVFDTAINYRCQRSERAIGRALARAVTTGGIARDEVFVSTKGGYLPFDGEPPPNPHAAGRILRETYVDSGIAKLDEIVGGVHCLAPDYLRDQIARSRRNLGLETVDLYYLHNPEQQLGNVARETFHERVRLAFGVLEEEVARGHIAAYGTATWNGYRAQPERPEHLSLADVVSLARAAGGEAHHFRAVQLPYNLAMTEALTLKNQPLLAGNGDRQSLLAVASEAGIDVFASSPILQGRLTTGLPDLLEDAFPALGTDARRAIQFVRSTPGVTSALVGMKQRRHVEENLPLAAHPPAKLDELLRLFETGGST
jgi:aryl-alcohol dehydrogenase-like predicted oxidoreductase